MMGGEWFIHADDSAKCLLAPQNKRGKGFAGTIWGGHQNRILCARRCQEIGFAVPRHRRIVAPTEWIP